MSTTSSDALKEEIARRLEAMKTTWRLLDLIGLQDVIDCHVMADEDDALTDKLKVDDQRRGVFKTDNTNSAHI